jgi:gamma-glutamyl:cysteine ligase YbdK (ATP-grasp superfamily)
MMTGETTEGHQEIMTERMTEGLEVTIDGLVEIAEGLVETTDDLVEIAEDLIETIGINPSRFTGTVYKR